MNGCMNKSTKNKVIDFLSGILVIGISILVAYAAYTCSSYYLGNSNKTESNHTQHKSSNSSGITSSSSRYNPIDEDEPDEDDVYYENCTEARENGAQSIREGEPGYREELDRDGDGVACEPWHGR